METAFQFPLRVPELRSAGILLREMNQEDVPAWYARLLEPEARTLAGDPEPNSIEQVHDWLRHHHAAFKSKSGIRWAIQIDRVAESVGSIGLVRIDLEARTSEIGTAIAKPYWRKGIVTRAADLVIDYALNELGLSKISADVLSSNVGSIRILEKLGFERVSIIRDYRDTAGLKGYLYETRPTAA